MSEQTKPGYKKTKLGWLPEDWEIVKLGDKGDVLTGLTYKPEDVKSSGTIVLRSSNIQNNRLAFDNNVFIDNEEHSYNPVCEGDILICVRNGSKNLIGKNTLITKDLEGAAFGAFMTIYRSKDYKYFVQLFKTRFWSQEIHKNLGATINSINGSDLKRFWFPFPKSKNEQQKIAQILSTWDKAISKLENLIEQKQARKKALMQQLLTGKKRFKEFVKSDKMKETKLGLIPEDWEVKRLEEVASFRNGKAHENAVVKDGDFVIVNSKFISTEGRTKKHSNKQIAPLMRNEIVIVMSDIPNGKALAKCFLIPNDNGYTLNQRIGALNANSMSHIFLFYFLNRNRYYLKFNDGVSQTNLKKSEVLNCPVFYPELNEQEKIASVLSAAGQEITKLQTQLKQLKEQKKGLMQKLLTGEVRVKTNKL